MKRFAILLIALCLELAFTGVGGTQDFPPPFGGGGGGGGGSYNGGYIRPRGPPQGGGFGSFFQRLFNPAPAPGFYPPRPIRQIPREPPLPTVDIVEKDAKARKVLVVGDFTAGGLAWGLDQTFAEEPKLAVLDRSNAASSLARPDVFDWGKELTNILNAEHPDVVVVMLGANDRQQMRAGNMRIAMHSAEWETAYVQRVENLVDTLKVYGRPFFWVSAPPMRTSEIADDMIYLNGLYKPRVEAAGGHYIDIWSGFTNEDGRYVSSGPDADGQVRALRTGDGINFTRAGRLKLAFYLDREIRKATGIGAGAVNLLSSVNRSNQIEIGPDGKKRLVGPVISLSDPLPGADDALAGAAAGAAPVADSPQYRLVVKGEALPTVAGRADDFLWPPGGDAPATPPAPTASTAAPGDEPGLSPVSKSSEQ